MRPFGRMTARANSNQIEVGDIFFFYRPKVQTEEVRGRDDVQRLYMVLGANWPRRIYRLFAEDERLDTAEVCRELRVSCARERVMPLLSGEFPEREERRGEQAPRA